MLCAETFVCTAQMRTGSHLFHDLIGSRSIQLQSFMLAGQGKAAKTTSDHDLDNLIRAPCIKDGFSLIFPVNFSSHVETFSPMSFITGLPSENEHLM